MAAAGQDLAIPRRDALQEALNPIIDHPQEVVAQAANAVPEPAPPGNVPRIPVQEALQVSITTLECVVFLSHVCFLVVFSFISVLLCVRHLLEEIQYTSSVFGTC